MDLNIKKIKVFKIIITALAFVSFLTGCKPAVIEEQPTQEQQINAEDEVVIPSETTPQTTVPETTLPTETTPPVIEYEGVVIPEIESLKFENGTFFALEGNPYGLEAGEKAGVLVNEGDIIEQGQVIAKAKEGGLGFRSMTNLSLWIHDKEGEFIELSKEMFIK